MVRRSGRFPWARLTHIAKQDAQQSPSRLQLELWLQMGTCRRLRIWRTPRAGKASFNNNNNNNKSVPKVMNGGK